MNRLILILLLIPNFLFSQNAKEVAKNCMPSTVSVQILNQDMETIRYGSGFIIGNEKVVTNFHVIKEAKFARVVINNQDKSVFTIDGTYHIDVKNDLAILHVPSLKIDSLKLGNNELPDIGEEIYVIGTPEGFDGTISSGIVSGYREVLGLIQFDAAISPGSSGGPVFNKNGERLLNENQ